MAWINRTEVAVSYSGDLDTAAQEVLSELDEQDGVVIGSKAFKRLIKQKAREFKVSSRDLAVRVQEWL